MKFKKPKKGHFYHYCYECNFWKYDKSIGCAHIGYCHAIPNDITTQDAYDKPCGLFKNRIMAEGRTTHDLPHLAHQEPDHR